MKNLHIAVFDESYVICEGLESVFSKFNFVQRISYASSFDELESVLRKNFCHMVIINPHFIQSSQNQFFQLRNQHICVKWIGIVYSHFSPEIISKLDGTIDVFDSKESLTNKLLKWIATNGDENTSQNKDTLTDREIDVLKLLADGKSNKEIADSLNISINTVITHRKNISHKTGIKSVSGLTIYAVVQNLISLDNY